MEELKDVFLHNRESQKDKYERTISVINEMLKNNEEISVAALVKRTKCSRGYFYKNEKVRAKVEAARKKQANIPYYKKEEVFDKAKEKVIIELKKALEKLNEENKELKTIIRDLEQKNNDFFNKYLDEL